MTMTEKKALCWVGFQIIPASLGLRLAPQRSLKTKPGIIFGIKILARTM
jgi:hypothetical protein